MITLSLYLCATVLTAAAWAPWWFLAMRFFTGAGIGGEYAAINSAIDEMIPARARGRVDLIINGSFWVGSAIGGIASIFLLKESLFALNVGWRISFALGAILGLGILFVRRTLPESPRWLFIHGREEEAERIVDEIEAEVREQTDQQLTEAEESITVRQRRRIPWRDIARTTFKTYPKRAVLGLSLFVGQAFIYNAVTITLGLTLTTYFGVGANKVGLFYAVFAAGNFMGPLLLGRLFDTVGRKPMIAGTYLLSAVMLVGVALLFGSCDPKSCQGQFSDWTVTLALAATFFFASAGASSAYLTVSEVFPMEMRALAIAFFYAIGTAIGGITGPQVFQKLGESGTSGVVTAYLIGAAVMAVGGIAEIFLGVRAEQRRLEDIAKPITAEGGGGRRGTGDRARVRRGPGGGRGGRTPSPGAHRARAGRAAAIPPRAWIRSFSPFFGHPAAPPRPEWLDHEIEIISQALQQHGELSSRGARPAHRGAILGPGPVPRRSARSRGRRRRAPNLAIELRRAKRERQGRRKQRSGLRHVGPCSPAVFSVTASSSGRRTRRCGGNASGNAASAAISATPARLMPSATRAPSTAGTAMTSAAARRSRSCHSGWPGGHAAKRPIRGVRPARCRLAARSGG